MQYFLKHRPNGCVGKATKTPLFFLFFALPFFLRRLPAEQGPSKSMFFIPLPKIENKNRESRVRSFSGDTSAAVPESAYTHPFFPLLMFSLGTHVHLHVCTHTHAACIHAPPVPKTVPNFVNPSSKNRKTFDYGEKEARRGKCVLCIGGLLLLLRLIPLQSRRGGKEGTKIGRRSERNPTNHEPSSETFLCSAAGQKRHKRIDLSVTVLPYASHKLANCWTFAGHSLGTSQCWGATNPSEFTSF